MSNYDNTNKGALFTNDQKGNEKAPNYKGKLNVNGKEYEIAGWVRQGNSGSFLSLTISEPFKKDNPSGNKSAIVYNNIAPKMNGDAANMFNDSFNQSDLPF
jgi:uncharacterized protein (DUF736 family)